MKRDYVKVKTSEVIDDMTRYLSYRGVKPTPAPYVAFPQYNKGRYHTFEQEGFTYFMRPTNANDYWNHQATARYASFGVKVEIVKLEAE